MKKTITAVLCIAMALTLASCGENNTSENSETTSTNAESQPATQTTSIASETAELTTASEESTVTEADSSESTSEEYYVIPEGYTLPFREDEFGTYSNQFGNTVTISQDGDKIHLTGNFGGYAFDLSFNDIERFDLPCENGNTILACYRVTDSARTIYFNEYDSEQNEVAYTHLAFDGGQLYINYGDNTNEILDKQ